MVAPRKIVEIIALDGDRCFMISQIYVSRSLIHPGDRAGVMDDILTFAIARNTMLGVTGLLIASPAYFAQLLEGPEPGVAAVMSSIAADSRHIDCRTLRRVRIDQARCPHWRMTRFDCQNFGNAIIDPLLMAAHGGTDHSVHRLELLIEAIVADPALSSKSLVRR